MADLKILAATLVETLEHAHHVRIEYPWQREARAAAAADARVSDQMTVAGTPEARAAAQATRPLGSPLSPPAPTEPLAASSSSEGIPTLSGRAETGRFVGQHQLDSADAPRQVFTDVASVTTTSPGTSTLVAGAATGPQGGPPTARGVPAVPLPPAVPVADLPFVDDEVRPPPPPRATTVELLKDVASQPLPVPAMEALAPGTLVIGAPPATNPRLRVFDRATTTPGAEPEVIAVDDERDTGPIVTQALPPTSMTPPRRRPPGNTRRG